MSDRYIRHNISGSEVNEPRPIAYVRRGWSRPRLRRGKPRPSLLRLAALALAAVLVVGAILLLVQPALAEQFGAQRLSALRDSLLTLPGGHEAAPGA